jgi:hypothetical protein
MSNLSPAAILHNTSGTEIGTGANPVRTDPTGTTTQPVSDGGGSLTIDAVSLPLPTGAATSANQATLIGHVDGLETLVATLATQATAAAIQAVLEAIRDTAGIKKITDALPAGTNNIGDVDVLTVPAPLSTTGGGTEAAALRVTLASDSTGLVSVDDNGGSLTVDTPQLPTALVGGRLDGNVGAWLGSTAPTVGQKAMASSVPVVMSSNQSAIPVTFTQSGSRTGVSSSFLTLGGGTAGTLQLMRATTYNEQSSAAQRSVASSDADDTAAGTGARTIRITYYDGSGAGPFTEDITLNGTTAVNTAATDIRFVESIEVLTAGASGANEGTITLYVSTGGGGGTIGTIGIGNLVTGVGDNRTFWGHHYVAADYTVELSTTIASIQSGGSATSGRVFLRAAKPLVANSAEVVVGGVVLVEGAFQRSYEFNPKVAGFARITAYAVPTVNNSTVSVAFDWSEVLT